VEEAIVVNLCSGLVVRSIASCSRGGKGSRGKKERRKEGKQITVMAVKEKSDLW
jgi:hypothetical protein